MLKLRIELNRQATNMELWKACIELRQQLQRVKYAKKNGRYDINEEQSLWNRLRKNKEIAPVLSLDSYMMLDRAVVHPKHVADLDWSDENIDRVLKALDFMQKELKKTKEKARLLSYFRRKEKEAGINSCLSPLPILKKEFGDMKKTGSFPVEILYGCLYYPCSLFFDVTGKEVPECLVPFSEKGNKLHKEGYIGMDLWNSVKAWNEWKNKRDRNDMINIMSSVHYKNDNCLNGRKYMPMMTDLTIYADTPLGKKVREIRDKHIQNSRKEHASYEYTLAEIEEAGAAVFEEFKKKIQSVEEEKERMMSSIKRNADPSEDELSRAKKARETVSDVMSEEMKKLLSDIRELFDPPNELMDVLCPLNTKSGKAVKKVLRGLPRNLGNDHLNCGNLTLASTPYDRSYYDVSNDKLAMSASMSNDHMLAHAVHELGHRLECKNPIVSELAQDFLKRRTHGQKEVKLKDLFPWSNYRDDEKTIPDNFLSPYIGKIYEGGFTEVISMGFEYFYTEPKKLKEDPDFAKFILGILAVL